MKVKFLTEEEHQTKFTKEGELVFTTESSISSVRSPKAIYFARHWHQPFAGNTTGTVYICRPGDAPWKFDFDIYSLQPDENGGPPRVISVTTEYHHTNNSPSFILKEMPNDVKNKIRLYFGDQQYDSEPYEPCEFLER